MKQAHSETTQSTRDRTQITTVWKDCILHVFSLMLPDGNLTSDSTKEKAKLNFYTSTYPFLMLFCTVYMKTKNKQKEL